MNLLTTIFGVIAIAIGMSLLLTLPVMWLWNWLMPDIFGFVTITFWQALGLNLLCGFLFRSTSNNNQSN